MSDRKSEKFALSETKVISEEDVENARILVREGLVEEAKKVLYRVLGYKPGLRAAQELLKQIEAIELKDLFRDHPSPSARKPSSAIEDIDRLIETLDRDLGLGLNEVGPTTDAQKEIWNAAVNGATGELDAKARFDLGVAFFEMGCYADALRELYRAEKKIRIAETFLGETGLAAVSLIGQCLVHLDRAYEAKAYLEPVLTEPDLRHEDKLVLYYAMGMIEYALENPKQALGWYQKISEADPDFKDVQLKVRQLLKPVAKKES